jgi:hypothetical protein
MCALALIGLVAGAEGWSQAPGETRYTWEDLGKAVAAQKQRETRLRVQTPTGARIEATVLEVTGDGLKVRVRKTSDRKAQPKGPALLPKDSLRRFELRMERGRPVAVGALVGLGVGAGIGAAIAQATPEEGVGVVALPAAGAAVAVIGAVVGYSIGRAKRWRTVAVTLAP